MFFTIALLALLQTQESSRPEKLEALELKPNILEFCMDDVGYADLASVPTPNIDALIAVSFDFPISYVTAPVCSASRASSLAGRYSSDFDIGHFVGPLSSTSFPPGVQTKATLLKGAGYQTAHFGKWHLNVQDPPAPGVVGGFDWFSATSLHNPAIMLVDGSGMLGDYFTWNRVDNGIEFVDSSGYMTEIQGDEAKLWWSNAQEPKFAQMWFMAAHNPQHIPPAYLLPFAWPVPTTEREKFEASIIAMDTMIGEILSAVDLNTTYVFLWSDNGTPPTVVLPGQDPANFKFSMKEGGINTPFYIHAPGQKSAAIKRRMISSVDFLETYADIANVSSTANDGVSFANQLGVQTAPFQIRDWIYAVKFKPNGAGPYTVRERMLRTLDGFKYIRKEKSGQATQHLLYLLPDEDNEITNAAKLSELSAIVDTL